MREVWQIISLHPLEIHIPKKERENLRKKERKKERMKERKRKKGRIWDSMCKRKMKPHLSLSVFNAAFLHCYFLIKKLRCRLRFWLRLQDKRWLGKNEILWSLNTYFYLWHCSWLYDKLTVYFKPALSFNFTRQLSSKTILPFTWLLHMQQLNYAICSKIVTIGY